MNALDVAIIATALGAGFGGWRLGLVARVFAWAGVFTGLAIGVQLRAAGSSPALGGNSADDRIGVALLFLFLVASIGQAFGLVIGLLGAPRVPDRRTRCRSGTGSPARAAGALGLLVLTWLVIPSLATAQGWPARMARDSWMVAAIQRRRAAASRRSSRPGASRSPRRRTRRRSDPLDTPPDPGAPPTHRRSRPRSTRRCGARS